MIKTAVIGASGYIGSRLFLKYRETFSDCLGTGFSRLKEGLTSFDLRKPECESLRLEDTGHKAVIISSAMPNVAWCDAHPKEAYELNVVGTLKLAEQLAKRSLSIFFLSSDYVFDGRTGAYSDQAETCPITAYGRQKAEVERELPQITDNYTILRLSKIYGTTWKDNTLIDGIAAALVQGQKITVATDQFFSPTHIDDVVAMTLYVQEKGIKGLVNLCHSNQYSRHQLAQLLVAALGVSPALIESTHLHAIPGMENRPLNTSLICSPCLEKLQPTLRSMDEVITTIAANWKRSDVSRHDQANPHTESLSINQAR
jgi:dTDP-4-dehydrorhamnose reductase